MGACSRYELVKLAVLQLLQLSQQKRRVLWGARAFSTLVCMHKLRAPQRPTRVRGTVQTGFLTHCEHKSSCSVVFLQQQARAIHNHRTQFPPFSARECLRNGLEQETRKRRASTHPRGNERPREVSFASDEASRRVSRALVVVIARPFRLESLGGPRVAYVVKSISVLPSYRCIPS